MRVLHHPGLRLGLASFLSFSVILLRFTLEAGTWLVSPGAWASAAFAALIPTALVFGYLTLLAGVTHFEHAGWRRLVLVAVGLPWLPWVATPLFGFFGLGLPYVEPFLYLAPVLSTLALVGAYAARWVRQGFAQERG
ncbi:MAG: hypothetical protein AAGG50_21380 [Bacteroidota bacterium]